jgi:hypothetical protein
MLFRLTFSVITCRRVKRSLRLRRCTTGWCTVLQKPRNGTDCLPPPRTLILDFTMTHTRYGRSHLSSLGQLTHSSPSDGAPEPDGALREAARTKIRHCRQLYINRPDPIAFMPVDVDTSGRVYDNFSLLLFLHSPGTLNSV